MRNLFPVKNFGTNVRKKSVKILKSEKKNCTLLKLTHISQGSITIPPDNSKNQRFWRFSGGIGMKHWSKIG